MNTKCNVGAIDRITRGLVGIIIGSAGLMIQMAYLRWALVGLGGILILTAVFAWCPLYYFSGRSTRSRTN